MKRSESSSSFLSIFQAQNDGFISRSQQQQQNGVLLQWKKWCDDYSFNPAKQYGVFVGAMLTGFALRTI